MQLNLNKFAHLTKRCLEVRAIKLEENYATWIRTKLQTTGLG
jgi:hypothetical protein